MPFSQLLYRVTDVRSLAFVWANNNDCLGSPDEWTTSREEALLNNLHGLVSSSSSSSPPSPAQRILAILDALQSMTVNCSCKTACTFDSKFCSDCGAPSPSYCVPCKSHGDGSFCKECGNKRGTRPVPPSAQVIGEEKKGPHSFTHTHNTYTPIHIYDTRTQHILGWPSLGNTGKISLYISHTHTHTYTHTHTHTI